MILSDNETRLDLINNRAIANTVAKLIKESNSKPLSIGIYGNWGAGKSSVLEMIEGEINDDQKENKEYICLRFNGWKHQGFEDSKIALMSSIISELEEKETFNESCKDIFRKLWKSINWFSVVKAVGGMAVSLATGTTLPALLVGAGSMIKEKVQSEEDFSELVDKVEETTKDTGLFGKDSSMNMEFRKFQKNFDELLDKTNIKKIVVLVDDLDRCLPEVTIETLEAVRLFMFSEKTAFVIAADETMIKYAVKEHFKGYPEREADKVGEDTYADKYLEKLIQVPFRIPTLGKVEASLYIMELLVGSVLHTGYENETTIEAETAYQKLVNASIEKLKKPWEVQPFVPDQLSSILGDEYASVSSQVSLAYQLSPILSAKSEGNPRKIKRFINMILLRKRIAESRGYGDAIKFPELAKMMLFEYYWKDQYLEMAKHLDAAGVCADLNEAEAYFKKSDSTIENGEGLVADNIQDSVPENIKWFDLQSACEWIVSEPSLSGVDLRPYYFLCKEKIDYLQDQYADVKVAQLMPVLMGGEMAIASKKDDIGELNEIQCNQAFNLITQRIVKLASYEKKPDGIEGLKALVLAHPKMAIRLAQFLQTFPVEKLGAWIASGWDGCFPKNSEAYKVYRALLKDCEANGSPLLQEIIRKSAVKKASMRK